MAEVAGLARLPAEPLAGGRYLRGLTDRLAAAPASADRAALDAELTELARQHGQRELALGAWHGDWTPWNMACTSGGLLLWDWERFAGGVPVGFDALHYQLQSDVVTARADPALAAAGLVERAPDLLAPLEVGAAAGPADRAAVPGRAVRPLPGRSPGRGRRPAGRARPVADTGPDRGPDRCVRVGLVIAG